jgi:hypothetical protein
MSQQRDTQNINKRNSHDAANRAHNAELVRFILLPTIFLFVALLGGVRVAGDTRALVFLPPPLVALILAALLMLLFARGGLIQVQAWLNHAHAPAVNIAHALTLLALYFAACAKFQLGASRTRLALRDVRALLPVVAMEQSFRAVRRAHTLA